MPCCTNNKKNTFDKRGRESERENGNKKPQSFSKQIEFYLFHCSEPQHYVSIEAKQTILRCVRSFDQALDYFYLSCHLPVHLIYISLHLMQRHFSWNGEFYSLFSAQK